MMGFKNNDIHIQIFFQVVNNQVHVNLIMEYIFICIFLTKHNIDLNINMIHLDSKKA